MPLKTSSALVKTTQLEGENLVNVHVIHGASFIKKKVFQKQRFSKKLIQKIYSGLVLLHEPRHVLKSVYLMNFIKKYF